MHTTNMLKTLSILAIAILAGQVLGADQALPTKLEHLGKSSASDHLELNNKLIKRDDLDADKRATDCQR